jgi:hypothetical protein
MALVGAASAVIVGGGYALGAAPPDSEPAPQFYADFSTPEDFYDRFVTDVHFRGGYENVDHSAIWSGDHNHACEGPDTQREVSAADLANLFWWCAPRGPESGHVMTSMGDIDGYAIVSFSPEQSFSDFHRVCWDVNLTDLGPRKWTQVTLIPDDTFLANGSRLDYTEATSIDEFALPLPSGSFTFQMAGDDSIRIFTPELVIKDEINTFVTDELAYRFHHCLTDNGDGTVTIEQEREDGVHTLTAPGSFPRQARVIFQDENYNPLKDGPISGFTWHWDNIEVG